jgi:ribosome-associated protein
VLTHAAAPSFAPASVVTPNSQQRSLKLALAAARIAAENRGQDVAVLDLAKVTPICDYFVIATGASRRQLHAICDEIEHTLKREQGEVRISREGFEESRWIILDYGNVVVHLMDEETREFYDLEGLWGDAVRVNVDTGGSPVSA